MYSLTVFLLSTLCFIFTQAQEDPSCPFNFQVSRFDVETTSLSTNSIAWSLQQILSEDDGHTLELTPSMVRKFKVRPDFKYPLGPIPMDVLHRAELILEMSGWSSVDMVDMRVKIVFPQERTDDLNFAYHFHENKTHQWKLLGSLYDFLNQDSVIELNVIAKDAATFYLDSLHLTSRFHPSNSDEEMWFSEIEASYVRPVPGTYDITLTSENPFLGFNHASYWNGVDNNKWWPLPVDNQAQSPDTTLMQHIEGLSETTKTLIMLTAFVMGGPIREYVQFPLPEEDSSFPCFIPGHMVDIWDSNMFIGEPLQITGVNHDSAQYRFTTTEVAYHVIYFENVDSGEVHYHRTVSEDGMPVMEQEGMLGNLMPETEYKTWAYALDSWGHVYKTESVNFSTVAPPPA